MPELPEVENTVRRLGLNLIGRRIRAVEIGWKGAIASPSPRGFSREVIGGRIRSIGRRGKFLIFCLDKSSGAKRRTKRYLIAHLRMSGSLRVYVRKSAEEKHVRLKFLLSGGHWLYFRDPRKFGRVWLVDRAEKVVGGLGPEPLSESFRAADFLARVKVRSGQIKPLLLNQKFLAGIGNIYADESLWRAGIHPRRSAASLSKEEILRLYKVIRQVLRKAIRDQGTDIGDRVVKGDYQPRVYGRAGKRCLRCKGGIVRMVVGQRGTYVCPGCQRVGA